MIRFILLLFFFAANAQARNPISSTRFEELSGMRGSNAKDTKYQWDKKYNQEKYVYGKGPASFLRDHFQHIQKGGKVLDMGMGEGRNAVFLASRGLTVLGVDISSVAVKKASALAKENKVQIEAVVADLTTYKIPKESLDAIICFYFVDRSLLEKMQTWLRPGGVIIFEAYTDHQRKVKGFEHFNKNFLLGPGELLTMFKNFHVLKYEEPLKEENFTASLVAQKPLL